MDVSKNMGKTPKMDGENNGTPYEQMDHLGGKNPMIFGKNTPHRKMVGNHHFIQGGPLLVINGVITPINGLING